MIKPLNSNSKYRAWAWGHGAEAIAKLYLMAKGYRIISHRYKTKSGEIDIVAYKNHTIIAVEVKARHTHEDGLFSITPNQKARITRTLSWFIMQNKKYQSLDLRFDVIVVKPWGWPLHIKNAWTEGM